VYALFSVSSFSLFLCTIFDGWKEKRGGKKKKKKTKKEEEGEAAILRAAWFCITAEFGKGRRIKEKRKERQHGFLDFI